MKVHSALSPGFVSLASSIGAGLPVFGMQAVSERMDTIGFFMFTGAVSYTHLVFQFCQQADKREGVEMQISVQVGIFCNWDRMNVFLFDQPDHFISCLLYTSRKL